jgi:hypothetical protein
VYAQPMPRKGGERCRAITDDERACRDNCRRRGMTSNHLQRRVPKPLNVLAFQRKEGSFAGELFNGLRDRVPVSAIILYQGNVSPRSEGHRTTCRGAMLSLEVPCIAVGRRPDETLCSDHVDRDSGLFGR